MVGRFADLRLRRALPQAREARSRGPASSACSCRVNSLLPALEPGDPINPEWAGQEATAFPDNWTIGMSFYTNVFAREHNAFVDEFRRGRADAGRRFRPAQSGQARRASFATRTSTPDELFEAARLVVAAEIAKIHTTEWTPQLLYDEPLYRGMNANWNGLLGGPLGDNKAVADALAQIVTQGFRQVHGREEGRPMVFGVRLRPGIFGLGSQVYADDPVFAISTGTRRTSGTYAIRTMSTAA